MKIGVISDTHGDLPRPALEALRGTETILHAGDVGEWVLEELQELGVPVVAVRGNTDPPATGLPLELRLELGGERILMRHIQQPPDRVSARELEALRGEGISVLVFGHTHLPVSETAGGVLFANPGSPSQPRFESPPSVGYLTVGEGPPTFRLAVLRS